ncbi:putative integral membrane protein [Acanthocheilonema viteae]
MSSDSINPTSLSSQSSGNILTLLNVLYTPGLPLYTPSLPLLNGRTMHALYAISFIIYSITDLCDWLFVYFTLRGYVTSFPLKTWLAIALASTTVFGSMLTSLLLVLCIENAFAHRLDIAPYRSGFAIIYEAFIQWVQAFNNFRVTFLFMILHDMPLTIMNFFFITSCRCVGPQILQWPLIISSSATTISILWRLVMLYFAYRQMIFPSKSLPHVNTFTRQPTIYEQFKLNLSQKNGGRLKDYDELWPVRYSVRRIYGPVVEDNYVEDNYEHRTVPVKSDKQSHRNALFKLRFLLTPILKVILTFSLTFIIYILSILTCCAPCCYHYICSSRSFYHRHKCSSSFVRFFSQGFHWALFITSLLLTIVLFVLNAILLSSVHGLGNNQIVFEISHVCVAVSSSQKTIQATIETSHKEHLSTSQLQYICKPIWKDGGFSIGLNRQEAGTWQTRITLTEKQILAISTKIRMEYENDRQKPHHTLYYDYVLLQHVDRSLQSYTCIPGNKTDWRFINEINELAWPYYAACDRAWSIEWNALINCNLYNNMNYLENKSYYFDYVFI